MFKGCETPEMKLNINRAAFRYQKWLAKRTQSESTGRWFLVTRFYFRGLFIFIIHEFTAFNTSADGDSCLFDEILSRSAGNTQYFPPNMPGNVFLFFLHLSTLTFRAIQVS